MLYHDFDLFIDKIAEGRYHLRAFSGAQSRRGVITLDHKGEPIQTYQTKLERRITDSRSLIEFGTFLYSSLFKAGDGKIETLFQWTCGSGLKEDEGIRLRLRSEDPEIASLPWEFLYSPTLERFLGTSVETPLLRFVDLERPIEDLEAEFPLRILVAIPQGSGLNVTSERKNLEEALLGLESSVQATYLDNGPVTRDRISDALLQQGPFHVFHFIGHGWFQDDRAFLLLNDDRGGRDLIGHEQFADLLFNHPSMKLVVLNSCKGATVSSSKPLVGMAPELVKKGIPAVIAMQYEIDDPQAVRFAREFYRSLFKGWAKGRIEVAMSHARARLRSEFPDDRVVGAPVLFTRAPDGVLFNVVTGRLPRDAAYSPKQRGTVAAVIRTREHNQAIYEQEGNQDAAEAERARIERDKRRLRFGKISVIAAVGVGFVMFFLMWLGIVEWLPPWVKVETYAAWIGAGLADKVWSDEMAIVAIDDRTQRELGAFDAQHRPRYRREHAKLVDTLAEAGARVVAFDMWFHEPTGEDAAFAAAIDRARNSESKTAAVIGVKALDGRKPRLLPDLRDAGVKWGALCARLGPQSAQQMSLVIEKQEGGRPFRVLSLALEALAAYHDAWTAEFNSRTKQVSLLNREGMAVKRVDASEIDVPGRSQRECEVIEAGDSVANMIIDFSPPEVLRQDGRRYSYVDLVGAAGPEVAAELKGKIVLVGLEAEGRDSFSVLRGLSIEERYGVELHAEVLNSLLTGVTLRPLATGWQFVIILVMAGLGAFIRYWERASSAAWRYGLLAAVLVAYLAFAVYAYSAHHVLLQAMYHVAALLLSFWVIGKLRKRWLA